MEKSFGFILKSNSGEIEKAGLRSSRFLRSHGFSEEAVDTQILMLKELINNGIKYGKHTPKGNEITVNICIAENTITFAVKNPVDETCCERLKELDETILFIRGYQDPFKAYLLKRKEAFENSSRSETNGLELARVAYKANAILDFFVSEDNILNLYAVRNLDGNFRN